MGNTPTKPLVYSSPAAPYKPVHWDAPPSELSASSPYELFHQQALATPQKLFMTNLDPSPVPYMTITPGKEALNWSTYSQIDSSVRRLASFIKQADLDCHHDRLVGIMAPNCEEWVVSMLALNRAGCCIVPLRSPFTDMASSLEIIDRTKLSVVFGSPECIFLLAEQQPPSLRSVVTFSTIKDLPGLQVHNLHSILNEGLPPSALHQVDSQSKSCLDLPFSLSSGTSSGALIQHTNRSILNSAVNTQRALQISGSDRVLLFLPLTHFYAQTTLLASIAGGASLGVIQPRDQALIEEIRQFKPSVLPVVPPFLLAIAEYIKLRVKGQGVLTRWAFKQGVKAKIDAYNKMGHLKNSVYDATVFDKFHKLLGSNLRIILSSGSALDPALIDFLRSVLSVPILEAYISTKAGAVCFPAIKDKALSQVGGPLPGYEVSFLPIPELGIHPSQILRVRGELLIRGAVATRRFGEAPDIDEEGWVHTGDVAEMRDGGAIRILERRESFFQISGGHFVSPGALEREYMKCPLVAQILVFGVRSQHEIVAIVVANEEAVMERAQKRGWRGDFRTICGSELLRGEIRQEMTQVDNKLQIWERVRGGIFVESEPWTPQNLLTETLKLRRGEALRKYKLQLERLFAMETLIMQG